MVKDLPSQPMKLENGVVSARVPDIRLCGDDCIPP